VMSSGVDVAEQWKGQTMGSKFNAATVCAAAIMATSFAALPADARSKKDDRYQDRYDDVQPRSVEKERRSAEPLSLDGRNTGRERTCGYELLKTDPYGVPIGPYCH
jgi:hypothetical protein